MKKKNTFIKISASALAAIMACSASVLPAFAAESKEESTEKEEVVYVNLSGDGSVDGIYVVNSFKLDEDGKIVDYGEYDSLRNMTTNDEIEYSDNKVTIDASSGKLYYEGKLDSNVMPWNISLHYFINGEEYSAAEIGGKSGKLEITLSITENKSFKGIFFDGYALQASMTLDTKKCSNIKADGATLANVGSDKQITYTMLPGKGGEYTITANVNDFEMSEISINGVPLSLSVDVDDSEIMDKVSDLIDAIEQLDDGAGELNDGVEELESGVKDDLQSGVKSLDDGAQQLTSGAAILKEGGSTLQSGAKSLKTGAESIDSGVNSLNSGIKQVGEGLNALNDKSGDLTGGSQKFKNALTQVQSALSGVSFSSDSLKALTDASSEIKNGIDILAENGALLQQATSFDVYKARMKENGLDIDLLQQNNAAVMETLQSNLTELTTQIEMLKSQGGDTSELEAQAQQIGSLIQLLGANNASIGGTEAYLDSLNENIGEYVSGIQTLQTAYIEFDSNISKLVNTLGGLVYNMSALSDAIDTLVEEYGKLDSGVNDYTDGVAQIVAGYSQLTTGAESLVSGSGQLKTGADSLNSGADNLAGGITELYDATGTLKDGTGEINDGVADLAEGIFELKSGSEDMKDGTKEMRDETSGMDTEITDKIDEVLESVTGGDTPVESFVSRDNTNIDSVQFVIKTGKIEVPDEEEKGEAQEENLTFWQKLLKLFGMV